MNKEKQFYEAPVLEVFPLQDGPEICTTSARSTIDPYEYDWDVIYF